MLLFFSSIHHTGVCLSVRCSSMCCFISCILLEMFVQGEEDQGRFVVIYEMLWKYKTFDVMVLQTGQQTLI